jgi:hypothetical protein
MRFNVENGRKWNKAMIARKIGYVYYKEDKKTGESTFIRRLGVGGYPRFHLYLKFGQKNHKLLFNLHLDQKRPVYKGSKAHSGEHEGQTVDHEAEAIKKLLAN